MLLNAPEKGKKTIQRADTGEYVKEYPMTDQDRQTVLDLQDKE